ncbi:MAG: PA domain-containing protein [Burkholderiaceae bacterium]
MSAETTTRSRVIGKFGRIAAAVGFAFASSVASAAATISITNVNAAGVGFNDATPAPPVGGNTGTTLGQQRLNAFTYAANIWGRTLTSDVTINIQAQFSALACTATSATLGSAGATQIFRDFAGAPVAGHWYSYALANKLAGADLGTGTPQINANFNSNLGLNANCLPGSPFYLGLDNKAGTAIDLVEVLLHELGHGLGFQTFTSGSSGAFQSNFPSIWDKYLLDNTTNKTWDTMTAAERVVSAVNTQHLVWTGAGVTAAAPSVLQAGTPELAITAPASAITTYVVGTASFGATLSASAVTAEIVQVVDQADGKTGLACDAALSPSNAAAVAGKIALVDRGVCGFAVKALTVQNAGAVGVVIADNVAGSPPPGLGGVDPNVTIPAVRITLADGTVLKNALAKRTRTKSAGVIGKLDLNPAVLAGADATGRVYLYTPNPFISGSSVSHYDTSAFPNLLMEPNINSDLTQMVTPPKDLTFTLLRDIGW